LTGGGDDEIATRECAAKCVTTRKCGKEACHNVYVYCVHTILSMDRHSEKREGEEKGERKPSWDHCLSRCYLLKFRVLMYKGKYGAVIGYKKPSTWDSE
jgi:hypothetical protein